MNAPQSEGQTKKTQNRNITRNIVYTALSCAMMAVCAWISIPTPTPFTLQAFAVFLCAGLLGWKRGTVAVLCYLAIGAAGVPVFSNFTGGVASLVGPTGGYLVGFLLTAFLTGFFTERGHGKIGYTLLGMVTGCIALYAFGTAWFFFLNVAETGIAGLWTALLKCVLPFIPFDACKIALALVLVRRLRPLLARDTGTDAKKR